MIDEKQWRRELYLETAAEVDKFAGSMWSGKDITGKALLWYSCDTIVKRVLEDYKKLLAERAT